MITLPLVQVSVEALKKYLIFCLAYLYILFNLRYFNIIVCSFGSLTTLSHIHHNYMAPWSTVLIKDSSFHLITFWCSGSNPNMKVNVTHCLASWFLAPGEIILFTETEKTNYILDTAKKNGIKSWNELEFCRQASV